MDGDKLREVRKQLHLSQMEAAELLEVSLVTYQRWEQGKARPQPYHLRQIQLKFKPKFQELESEQKQSNQPSKYGNESQRTLVAVPVPSPTREAPLSSQIDEPQTSIPMTFSLVSLAYREHPVGNDRCVMVRQAIKEFDRMNTDNKSYQITRREAIATLAALPMATLGLSLPGKTVQSAQYGAVLAHCATSLEACWELHKSTEASDLSLAFTCVSRYLSLLKTIVRDSLQYRQEAVDLAGRYAVLKTILGWHCKGIVETIPYAKTAVALCKEAGDISLQLSAYSKLAWAYLYDKKYSLALETVQEAQFLLEQEQDKAFLPPCIWGGTYSTLALIQTKNGKSCDVALGKATEIDPGDESYAFMQFTRSGMPMEIGLIYSNQGNQAKAMESFEKIIDPMELVERKAESGRSRLSALSAMAQASLKAKDRDMEKVIHFWDTAVECATTLQSEWGFNKVVTTYELMEVAWPGEKRIADLREHIIHW